ncbi:MAG: ABC transporter permease [Myxococcales bacterium]|nr:ABC transporter permease [Myxococcales bacterium]
MQTLNFAVEDQGLDFAVVAKHFIQEENLIPRNRGVSSQITPEPDPATSILQVQNDQILNLIVEHLTLTGIAVGLAIIFALPLGIIVARYKSIGPIALGIAGVIQTIPSLALLALMIPIPGLGLGYNAAIAALFLYAILPILRNTYTGIAGVDAQLIEAARGLGLTERQILWHVQLPLAVPTIMAGIRTSTVISIGVATLAAFIGAGGLGELIITGLQLNDHTLVLTGAIPAALLALLVDSSLGLTERWATPRGLSSPAP